MMEMDNMSLWEQDTYNDTKNFIRSLLEWSKKSCIMKCDGRREVNNNICSYNVYIYDQKCWWFLGRFLQYAILKNLVGRIESETATISKLKISMTVPVPNYWHANGRNLDTAAAWSWKSWNWRWCWWCRLIGRCSVC